SRARTRQGGQGQKGRNGFSRRGWEGGRRAPAGSNRQASQKERDRAARIGRTVHRSGTTKDPCGSRPSSNARPPRSRQGSQRLHSIVTDSTMMMARTKGISLVMRQKRPEYLDVPAAIFLRCPARNPCQPASRKTPISLVIIH